MAEEKDSVLNRISNDQYGYLEAFTELAKDCFTTLPDDTKFGLYGYITEISAHAAKSAQFHRNMLYNEYFLNTCIMPSTVYNTAESEGVELKTSTPANATIILEIPKTKLLNLIDSSSDGWLELNREKFLVDMDGTEFRLPYSVIVARENNGIKAFYRSINVISNRYNVKRAEAKLFNTAYDFKSVNVVPIKEAFDTKKGESIITFSLLVYNVKFNILEENYSSASNNSISKFMIDFEKNYVSGCAFERDAEATEWNELKILTSSLQSSTEEEHNVYLKRLDLDTILFYFGSTNIDYVPIDGTALKFMAVTCDGPDANFTFKGNPSISIENADYASEFTCWVFASPAGGMAEDDIMIHKKDIYTARTKAKLLGSENDLNEYFASTSIGNDKTKILVIKDTDDFISRKFSAFALLRDDDCTYETNTLQRVYLDKVITDDEGHKTILPSMPIVYSGLLGNTTGDIEYEPGPTEESKDKYMYKGMATVVDMNDTVAADLNKRLTDRNHFLYFSPFTIVSVADNTNKSFVFNEHLNETYSVNIINITSDTIDTPIINYVHAKRNPALGPLLSLYVYVTESTTAEYKYFILLKNSEGKQIAVALEKNSSEGCYQAFLPINKINITEEGYNAVVKTDMATTLYNENWVEIEPNTEVLIPNIVEAKVLCLEKIDTANLIEDNKDDYEELDKYTSGSDIDDYRMKTISRLTEKLMIFDDLNDIFDLRYDKIKYADLDPDWAGYDSDPEYNTANYIYNLPVVGGKMLFSESVYNSFVALLKTIVSAVRTATKNVHNNTFLNLKFFNTYGYSDFWKIQKLETVTSMSQTVRAVDTKEDLKRPNLYYEIYIDGEKGYDYEADTTVAKITREWTEKLFDTVKDNVLITERISLSTLTAKIEEALSNYDGAQIRSINNIYHARYICPKEGYRAYFDSSIRDPDFVPSFPSISLGILNDTRSLKKEYDILTKFIT
jgi:hypothetical protein